MSKRCIATSIVVSVPRLPLSPSSPLIESTHLGHEQICINYEVSRCNDWRAISGRAAHLHSSSVTPTPDADYQSNNEQPCRPAAHMTPFFVPNIDLRCVNWLATCWTPLYNWFCAALIILHAASIPRSIHSIIVNK